MVPNQGLQGIAFFEATVCLTLLVLFLHLRRDNPASFYRLWLCGWVCLTLSSFAELALFYQPHRFLQIIFSAGGAAALALFLASILQYATAPNRLYWPMWWLTVFNGSHRWLLPAQRASLGRNSLGNGNPLQCNLHLRRLDPLARLHARHRSRWQTTSRGIFAPGLEQHRSQNLDARGRSPPAFCLRSFSECRLGHRHDRHAPGVRAHPLRGNQRKNAPIHHADGLQQPIRLHSRTSAKSPHANYRKRECHSRHHPAPRKKRRHRRIYHLRLRRIFAEHT